MKNKDFLNALGEIDKEFIEDAEKETKKVAFSWSKIGVIAASVAVLASVLALTFALNQGNNNPPIITTPNGTTAQSTTQGSETTILDETKINTDFWNGQTSFDDLEGFIAHEKELGEKGSNGYYIIPAANEDFELWYVHRQEPVDGYTTLNAIDVNYKLKGVEVDPGDYNEIRMNTISLRYELMGTTEEGLQYLEKQGYEKIQYNGKNMYVTTRTAVGNSDIVGYGVVFIENGCRIGINLPAIDTLENMLRFTEIQKVEIK